MGRLTLCASCHREISLEADLAAGPAVNGWDGSHHGGRVEHMVVEREIIGRDDVGAEIALTRPGFASQICGGGKECRLVGLPGPVAFERCFQFTAGSDAGKPRWRQ